MADGDISESEWTRWMHPRDALLLLSPEFRVSDAAASILRRLKGGRIQAAAESSEWQGYRPQDPSNMIPAEYWKRVNVLPAVVSFWSSSDIEISIGAYNRTVIVQYFGVRFKPDQVQALLAGTPKAASAQYPSSANLLPVIGAATTEAVRPPPKEPPVAEAHLQAWADIFQAAYPNGDADLAWESAKGAFPGKHVARQRVRDLLGPRPRGRPRGK